MGSWAVATTCSRRYDPAAHLDNHAVHGFDDEGKMLIGHDGNNVPLAHMCDVGIRTAKSSGNWTPGCLALTSAPVIAVCVDRAPVQIQGPGSDLEPMFKPPSRASAWYRW
jgi:hypothetical protein